MVLKRKWEKKCPNIKDIKGPKYNVWNFYVKFFAK